MATKVKSSKSKFAKASKKGCGPKGPKKPAKPKAASKKPKASSRKTKAAPAAQRVARRFPRGQSPFSSPTVGTTVYSPSLDITREVTAIDDHGYVTFVENGPSGETKTKTVAKGSWAQWCSRTKASVLVQEVAAAAAVADSPTEEHERIADEILAETEEGSSAAE